MKKNSLSKIIQNDILCEIASHQLKPGDKIPTEYELMEKYKVSRITASSALTELAKQNIISRYPRRGSFINENIEIPNLPVTPEPQQFQPTMAFEKACESISAIKRTSIGVIMPSIRDLFAVNIIHGISSCFYTDPNFFLNISYSGSQALEEYLIDNMMKTNVDGILLFPVDQEIYNEKILEMKVNKFPFVLMDRYLPGIDSHYVISDNVYGGQLATSHLCDLNHKNILICCGAELDTFSVKERVQGYKNELKRRNIPVHKENIIIMRFNRGKANQHNEDMLLDPKYTGIITTDSATAMSLYDFYKKHNIRIPEDKSLISYDAPIANMFDFNPFTFVDQKEYTLGQKAGMIMKDLLLKKNNYQGFVQKLITPNLVINRTTAPAKDSI